MIKKTIHKLYESKEVECHSSIKGRFPDDMLKFHLIRWTEDFEHRFCDDKKMVRLSLVDKDDTEFSVCYLVNSEKEKDKIYNILSEFIEKMDGKVINCFDYSNDILDNTKFPVIEGIERKWEWEI